MRRIGFTRRGTIATLCLLGAALGVTAQQTPPAGLRGEIEEAGFTRIKIAVPDAETSAGFRTTTAELVETLRQDLIFSGYFDVIDPSLYALVPPAEDGEIRHDDWISIGADALVMLRVPVQDDRIDMEARLYDNPSRSILFARRYGGAMESLRRVAHLLADDMVRHYTGRPGVALSRIAFVSENEGNKEIYLMDYDGRRIRRLTSSGTINLSPVWSPDGQELAFTSWRGRQPGVYVMSAEGELRVLRTVGGELSSAPDWSPDGKRIAYSSDVDGNTEIYVLDRPTGRNRRLTYNRAIDTAPAFSPNGRELAFTSDRSGSPQIYVMDTDGLNVRRLSWEGSYSDSPAWSPRGDRLAYATRLDGRFHIVVLDIESGRVARLTRGGHNNENPRWSPDGRHLVFASDRRGAYHIYTMGADGANVRRLTRGQDGYTPDWSR
jgi:TolB protein